MEIGSIREETFIAERSAAENLSASLVEQGLESVILEYAISTFPFSGALLKTFRVIAKMNCRN